MSVAENKRTILHRMFPGWRSGIKRRLRETWQTIVLFVKVPRRKNDWYLVLPDWTGIGDALFARALVDSFRRARHAKRVHLVAQRKVQYELLSLFSDPAVPLWYRGMKLFDDTEPAEFRPGKLIGCHPHCHGNTPRVLATVGMSLNLFSSYADFLGCEPTVSLPPPRVSPRAREKTERAFARLGGVKDRTVLLMPGVRSLKNVLSETFWDRLGRRLEAAGYRVLRNSDDGVWLRGNGMEISFPLERVTPMSELAGHCVTYRSGIADLLYFGRASLVVLYPVLPYFTATPLKGSGLARMFGARDGLTELDIPSDVETPTFIDDIVTTVTRSREPFRAATGSEA